MCRIVGFLDFTNRNSTEEVLVAMRDSLAVGGPDSAGVYLNESVGLAHRRLSIIDLSAAGFQPMVIGKWIITYNGEVYNYQQIKDELLTVGCDFKTKTDTEVIVRAIETWGKEAVNRFRGMFAFALWNTEEKKLILYRDRLGVKPLYWYYKDGLFLFASELKAFHKHPEFDKTIDITSLPHYFQKGYIHPSHCIYKYARQVPPGSFLEIDSDRYIKMENYWDVKSVYNNAVINRRPEEEILAELESKLLDSFKLRMVSDVEVGVFLSGGVDSSLATALLQHGNPRKLKTFTIGFNDQDLNEAEVANLVAKELGTDHTSLTCTEEEVREVLPLLSTIYDEPFGDSSSIPTYLVSKLARASVKVALSGDGGDELFGGYSKYRFAKHAKTLLGIPYSIRRMMNKASFLLNPNMIGWLSQRIGLNSYTQIGGKYMKFQETLLAQNLEDFFEKSSSYLSDINRKKFTGDFGLHLQSENVSNRGELISFFGLNDMLAYLPGDILTKVDRASMYVALESREPFLDPELLAFSFTIPDSLKISKDGESKYLLKKILSKYISPDLINRPKQGFTVPITSWLNGILKENIVSMSEDTVFFNTFQLDEQFFKEVLRSFYNGEYRYNPHFIWFVYTLYNWYKKWM